LYSIASSLHKQLLPHFSGKWYLLLKYWGHRFVD
jgi:hypothetical protein